MICRSNPPPLDQMIRRRQFHLRLINEPPNDIFSATRFFLLSASSCVLSVE